MANLDVEFGGVVGRDMDSRRACNAPQQNIVGLLFLFLRVPHKSCARIDSLRRSKWKRDFDAESVKDSFVLYYCKRLVLNDRVSATAWYC